MKDNIIFEIVTWPESQMLMEHPEFHKKCYLINEKRWLKKYGSGAYFVPIGFLDEAKLAYKNFEAQE